MRNARLIYEFLISIEDTRWWLPSARDRGLHAAGRVTRLMTRIQIFLPRESGQGRPQGAAPAGLPLDSGESGGNFVGVNRSELYHGQAGDSFEIAEVQCRHFVAKMQRCRANQQVLKRKLDAHRFLLALDAPGQPRNGECH